jgi:hypothetical protein
MTIKQDRIFKSKKYVIHVLVESISDWELDSASVFEQAEHDFQLTGCKTEIQSVEQFIPNKQPATIRDVLENHRNGFDHSPFTQGLWKWSCTCGAHQDCTSHEQAIRKSVTHVADAIIISLKI